MILISKDIFILLDVKYQRKSLVYNFKIKRKTLKRIFYNDSVLLISLNDENLERTENVTLRVL